MTKINNDPIQKISMANKLRLLASATRVVHDQATLMEAAQQIDGLVKGLQNIAVLRVYHTDVNELDYKNAFEMCQLIAYETVELATPDFKGKPLKR